MKPIKPVSFIFAVVVVTAALLSWDALLVSLLGSGDPLTFADLIAKLSADALLLLPAAVVSVVVARGLVRSRSKLSSAAGGAVAFTLLLVLITVAREAARFDESTSAVDVRLICTSMPATSAGVGDPLGLMQAAGRDALLMQLPMLPVLLLLLWARRRERLLLIPAAAVFITCTQSSAEAELNDVEQAIAEPTPQPPITAPTPEQSDCPAGAPLRQYEVSAIPIVMTLNRFGDHDPTAFMYVLDSQLQAVREQEALPLPDRVSVGLRRDAIQPLVLRANLGDCLQVKFTNRLSGKASMHFHGLPHTAANAGGATGRNPDTFAEPGQTMTYTLPIPREAQAERAYHIHDHGDSRQRIAHGLFGALIVEPLGAEYLDPDTGGPLTTTSWEAIIRTPGSAPDFREHVIIYHEVGDEKFEGILTVEGNELPVVDDLSGAYRPGSRAINYRSEPFRDRLQLRRDESLAYSSYTFGDPATPVPRSYLGEPTKQRLVHGGGEVFHVHHLHGGGDRWKRDPKVGPSLFALGLTKMPGDSVSLRVDAQTMGPGSTWNAEIECGAGGCQQAAGDFLFHCHIQHHYLAGMWSFWRVFDTKQPDLAVLPDRAPPPEAVESVALVGRLIEGKRLVPKAKLRDHNTQRALEDWIEAQLPPRGVPLDNEDAAVWDWAKTDTNRGPLYFGEPETTAVWANYQSPTPEKRPVIKFNPNNGRYAYPLLRPHLGKRPPFPGNGHSGAPWLGEVGTKVRRDGLCPDATVVPLAGRKTRVYPISLIQTPIPVAKDKVDDDGLLYILNEDRTAILSGLKPKEPLVIRTNVLDCAEIFFTNEVPTKTAERFNQPTSKANIHSHLVQFDPQGSDGVDSGLNFEGTVLNSKETENRKLLSTVTAGSLTLTLSNVSRLRVGVWIGIGLGEGMCGTNPERACTEVRRIAAIKDNSVLLDRPLTFAHAAGQYVGVEFARYLWYSDVDDGTVFWHDHVTPGGWAHGAFGAHIIEPRGSTWRDPVSGLPVRSGTRVDIHAPQSASVGVGQNGSFREFFLGMADEGGGGKFRDAPLEGTLNLRGEPLGSRTEPGSAFSSVRYGDPFTPLLRAYVGDDVMFRGLSAVNQDTGLRVTGHRFRLERFLADAPLFDSAAIGVSERFDFLLEGGAGGVQRKPGDYLYYQTVHRKLMGGAWGIFRVHDRLMADLRPLPGTTVPTGAGGFPQLGFSGARAQQAPTGVGSICPSGSTVREHSVRISRATIGYAPEDKDISAVAYILQTGASPQVTDGGVPTVFEPLVLRVNEWECLRINLFNELNEPAGIQLAELAFDPRTSFGVAVGFNPDSSVMPGQSRTFEYFADDERVGIALAVNLSSPKTMLRGAYGAVVVEPRGSVHRDPFTGALRSHGRIADILVPDGGFREFVALVTDEDEKIGDNTMPYEMEVKGFTGISYAADPLDRRVEIPRGPLDPMPWNAFQGEPRLLARAYSGDRVVFRVGLAVGEQAHSLGIEGHRFPLTRYAAMSEHVSSVHLLPGVALDAELYGGAGAGFGTTGDYLFFDQRLPFMEAGLWGVLRVLPPDSVGPRLLPR